MVDFTVAIPTYNGETRLPQLLERLRHQNNTEDFSWDIVVVDNNSRDRTTEIIQQTQATWTHPWPLRYSFEPQQGLAFARQRCITEAQAPRSDSSMTTPQTSPGVTNRFNCRL